MTTHGFFTLILFHHNKLSIPEGTQGHLYVNYSFSDIYKFNR